MIPTPKRKVLTKTTINTAGDSVSATATAATPSPTPTTQATTQSSSTVAASSAPLSSKTPKPSLGDLPTPTDEYAPFCTPFLFIALLFLVLLLLVFHCGLYCRDLSRFCSFSLRLLPSSLLSRVTSLLTSFE